IRKVHSVHVTYGERDARMIAPRFSNDLCRRIDPDHDTRREAPSEIGGNRPRTTPHVQQTSASPQKWHQISRRGLHRSPAMGSQNAFMMTVRVQRPFHITTALWSSTTLGCCYALPFDDGHVAIDGEARDSFDLAAR